MWLFEVLTKLRLLTGEYNEHNEEKNQQFALNLSSVQRRWCSMLCRSLVTLSLIPHTACSESQLTWEQPQPRNTRNNKTYLIGFHVVCSTVIPLGGFLDAFLTLTFCRAFSWCSQWARGPTSVSIQHVFTHFIIGTVFVSKGSSEDRSFTPYFTALA